MMGSKESIPLPLMWAEGMPALATGVLNSS
jgi:hypothetical protein